VSSTLANKRRGRLKAFKLQSVAGAAQHEQNEIHGCTCALPPVRELQQEKQYVLTGQPARVTYRVTFRSSGRGVSLMEHNVVCAEQRKRVTVATATRNALSATSSAAKQ